MRRIASVAMYFAISSCGNVAKPPAVASRFKPLDTEQVVRLAMDHIAKVRQSDSCMLLTFNSGSSIIVEKGDRKLEDAAPHLIAIPETWLPKSLPACGTDRTSIAATYQINRPVFRNADGKNSQYPVLDVGFLTVTWMCGADHLCGAEWHADYIRTPNSGWKQNSYSQGGIIM